MDRVGGIWEVLGGQEREKGEMEIAWEDRGRGKRRNLEDKGT